MFVCFKRLGSIFDLGIVWEPVLMFFFLIVAATKARPAATAAADACSSPARPWSASSSTPGPRCSSPRRPTRAGRASPPSVSTGQTSRLASTR